MSIPYSGTFKRSSGIISAINKQINLLNLKGCKRITVSFDPFAENVKHTRDFLFILSTPKIVKTNPNCVVKTDIVCNRAPAEVKISLIEAAQEQAKFKEVKFLSENLNTLDLLQLFNKHITPLAPKEEVAPVISSKTTKPKSGSATKKKK